MYAKVIVDIPTSEVDELFTYKVPRNLEECIYLGSRVFVEFGFQKVLGYVLDLTTELDFVGNIKDILEVIDFENGLTLEQIALAKELANSLMTNLTSTLNLMYPSFMKSKIKKTINVLNYDKLDADVALLLGGRNNLPISNNILSIYPKIKKEIAKGNLQIKTNVYTYGKNKLVKHYFIKNSTMPSTEKRVAVMNYLKSVNEASLEDIKENTYVSDYVVNKLLENENLGFTEKLVVKPRLKAKSNYTIEETVDLGMQINKFNKVIGKPYLLYTNDLKFRDDFLLNISKEIIKADKQVLIITPTILENTKVTLFMEKATDYQVLAFTSKTANSEYYYNYNRLISDDSVDIIITTKSGIFLPIKRLGLIIVIDSESKYYANEQNPKYNALDVAFWRTEYNKSKIVLASSSPSIEDYYNYYINKYTLIANINTIKTTDVALVDMKEEYLDYMLSKKLKDELLINFQAKKVSVLILNSLAYNQIVLCDNCQRIIKCPNCKMGLSYHKTKNTYYCSTCNYSSARPTCECGDTNYKHFGFGLELLKETLNREYLGIKIIQVDSESFASENDYQDLFLALEEREVDIIIGTYPLAALNHEDIKLFGLISIDSLLNKQDYRSSEEVYELTSKLALRNVKLIIQGYNLKHYSLLYGINQEYEKFFEKELENRKLYDYPPFYKISRLLVIGDYKDIYYFANYFKKIFARMSKTNILGPVYLSRIKGIQLIIKYNEFDKLTKLIDEVKKKFSEKKLIINFERYPVSFN